MLKNVMFWFLAACAALRLGALSYILWTGSYNLPMVAIIISAFSCILILGFIAKKYLFGCKRKEMEIIFIIDCAAVLINTLYVRMVCLATLSYLEIIIIGSFFEVLAGLTFVFLSKRRTKYATIAQNDQ